MLAAVDLLRLPSGMEAFDPNFGFRVKGFRV